MFFDVFSNYTCLVTRANDQINCLFGCYLYSYDVDQFAW